MFWHHYVDLSGRETQKGKRGGSAAVQEPRATSGTLTHSLTTQCCLFVLGQPRLLQLRLFAEHIVCGDRRVWTAGIHNAAPRLCGQYVDCCRCVFLCSLLGAGRGVTSDTFSAHSFIRFRLLLLVVAETRVRTEDPQLEQRAH